MMACMRHAMRTLAALLLLLTLALPAGARDWINCFSVGLDQGAVATTNGDLTDDGTYTLAFELGADEITFTYPDGATVTQAITPDTVDVTACEDGSVFSSGLIPGQDIDWADSAPVEEVSEPVVTTTAQAPTVVPVVSGTTQDLIDALVRFRPW